MAAGDMVIKGTTVIVGFNSFTYSGSIMDSVSRKPIGDIKEIRGENNAVTTKLISNPGFEISVEVIVTTLASFNAIKKGDTFTINTVNYMVVDCDGKYSREEVKWSISAIKEDSMTYT
jgi:hypothetical protein